MAASVSTLSGAMRTILQFLKIQFLSSSVPHTAGQLFVHRRGVDSAPSRNDSKPRRPICESAIGRFDWSPWLSPGCSRDRGQQHASILRATRRTREETRSSPVAMKLSWAGSGRWSGMAREGSAFECRLRTPLRSCSGPMFVTIAATWQNPQRRQSKEILLKIRRRALRVAAFARPLYR